jgi:hypothetical protein
MRIHTKTVWQLTDDPNEFVVLQDDAYEYSGPVALADRSAQAQASNAAATAGSTAAGYGSTASGVNSFLTPQLERNATNPIGFTPTETNNMLVAGEQGAGGATSGITGQAGLQAARTRNSGALSGVLDQAARTKQQQLSQNALGVQNESAKLAQAKQASALSGLQGLYGTDVGAQLKSMGIQDQDINTEIQAGQSGWLQNATGVIGALGKLGQGVGSAMSGAAAMGM